MARKSKSLAKAMSLHVGLNAVNPKHYEGWSGELVACEFDAQDMAAIAHAAGMKPIRLLTKKATRPTFLQLLDRHQKRCNRVTCYLLPILGMVARSPM